MKVSGQFASTETAEYHAMVMTYLENCKKNGINSFDAITAMFEGKPYTVESLNLVEHLDYKEMYHPSAPPVSSELNKTPPDQKNLNLTNSRGSSYGNLRVTFPCMMALIDFYAL